MWDELDEPGDALADLIAAQEILLERSEQVIEELLELVEDEDAYEKAEELLTALRDRS